MNDEDIAGWALLVAKGIAILGAVVVGIYDLVIVYLLFVGGDLPLLGWHVEANWLIALVFLFVGTTITATIAYWAMMIICLPILGLGYLTRRRIVRPAD